VTNTAVTAVSLVGLVAGGHSGVPRYTVMLSRALDRVAPEFPELRLVFLTTERGAALVAPRHLEVRLPPGPLKLADSGPLRITAEQALARLSTDSLLHFFDLSGPVLAPSSRFTTTVHDASVAHGYGRRGYSYKRLLCPWVLRRAEAAVAVSAFARDEAVAYFGGDSAKIRVIHSGPGLEPRDGGGYRTGERRPFLLYVGNLGVNKNLPFLVAAFAQAAVDYELVLAGTGIGPQEGLRSAIASSGAARHIRVVTNATDADVERLYRTATALVLPSRYEGFGFPALEAMARGCPVLASDIPALREISGSGALLLPVDDVGAWADAMRRVTSDERLRAELRARGAATAARYSWDATARGVLGLFGEISATPRP
jgi:glycosyltransferase involved in cell wall biosynthesis